MKKIKGLCLILIAFFLISSFYIVNAATENAEGFLTLNEPTKISVETNDKTFSDVKLILTDKQGLKVENINFYTVKVKDGKSEKGSKLANSTFLKSNPEASEDGKKITYIITNKYLNKAEKKFYVEIKDNKGKISNQFLRIIVKENVYKLDLAPRIKDFNMDLSAKKVSFITKDNNGTSLLRLFDVNANDKNKVVVEKKNLKDKESKVEFALSSFKVDEKGYYRIRIEATDGNKSNKQSMSTIIAFSIGKLTMTSVPTTKSMKVGATTQIKPEAKLENNSKDFQIKMTYTSSNPEIVSVDEEGKLKALKKRICNNNGKS